MYSTTHIVATMDAVSEYLETTDCVADFRQAVDLFGTKFCAPVLSNRNPLLASADLAPCFDLSIIDNVSILGNFIEISSKIQNSDTFRSCHCQEVSVQLAAVS